MAWENLLAQPNALKPTTLSDFYQPPTTQDMIAIAAFGDTISEQRRRNRIQDMKLKDEADTKAATLKYANALGPSPWGSQPSGPPGHLPNVFDLQRTMNPGFSVVPPQQPGFPAGPLRAYQNQVPNALNGPQQAPQPAAAPLQPAPAQRPALAMGANPNYQPQRTLMARAQQAIAAGDNDALQQLVISAKSDPYMSKLIPPDFSISVSGPGEVKLARTMNIRQIRDLILKASDKQVQSRIMQAKPGQAYEYTLKNGRVAEFKPAGVVAAGMQAAASEPTTILRSVGKRMGSKLGARAKDFGSEAGKLAHNAWKTGGTDPYRGTFRPFLRMEGDIAGAANDIIGEGVSVANAPVHNKFDPLQTRYVPYGTQIPREPYANDPVEEAGRWALKQGGKYYELFKKTHPEVAKDLEAAAAIAGWLPIFGGSKIVKEGIGSAVERAGGALEGAEARGAKEALSAAREGTEGAAEGLPKGGEPRVPSGAEVEFAKNRAERFEAKAIGGGQTSTAKSNTQRMAQAAMKNPELDIANLEEGYRKEGDVVKKGTAYYNDRLMGKKTYCPALDEDVTFDKTGLEYLQAKSEDEQARRFNLLPKAEGVIAHSRYIDPDDIRLEGKNHYRYGLIGRFKDGTVVRVVVDQQEKEGKKFLSIFDIEDLKGSKLSRKGGL